MDFSLFTFLFSLIKRALPLMLLSCLMACNGNKQKKSSKTFVSELSLLKEGGYLLSRIALQYHRRKWA